MELNSNPQFFTEIFLIAVEFLAIISYNEHVTFYEIKEECEYARKAEAKL